MRRKFLVFALMASTSLTVPSMAVAGPVGFLPGLIAGFGASATTTAVATALGGATLAGFSVSAFLTTTLLGRVVLSLGLSALANALTPKPQIPPASARLANFAQPVAYFEWAFGECRKGGPVVFTKFHNSTDTLTNAGGKKRHYSVALASHEIKGVKTHYLDERTAEIDGNGLVTTSPMAGYYRIRLALGAPGQTADAELVNSFPEVTSAHDFKGLAVAHIWAKKPADSQFSEIYPQGRQGAYTPVIEGNNQIYDPRDGTRKYTRNGALIMAHWITEILGQSVDWDEVGTEADASDEIVTKKGGGTQTKWQINGVLSDDQEFEDQRAQVAVSCDAWIYERTDGKVGFKVGRWIEPTITLTSNDFFSCSVASGGFGAEKPSEVAVRYVEPANKYREAVCGPYVIDATSRQKREEPHLVLVTDHNQASRLSKRIAKVKDPEFALRGQVGLIGYSLIGERFIRIENAEIGVDSYFEIGRLERDDGGFSFSIEANSTAATDFDFDAATEEADPPTYPDVTAVIDIIDALTLTGTSKSGGAILWELTSQDESLSYQLRTRAVGESEWVFIPIGQVTSYRQTGLLGGVEYEAQVRSVANLNVFTSGEINSENGSEWQPGTTVKVTVDTETPDDLVDVIMAGESGLVRATGTGPTWTNFRGILFYSASVGAGFGAASQLGFEHAVSPATAFNETEAIAAGDYDFWVAPVGNTGTVGAEDGPHTLTIT